MKIRRRIKRTTKQFAIVAIICIVVIGGAATFTAILITGQIQDEYSSLLREAYHEMEINQRNVYVATSDISPGEAITKDNVKKKLVYSSQSEANYITEEELGKVSLLAIPRGTQVIHSMLTINAVTSELREVEYNVINISLNMKESDTVDVRIVYPNGESYVVVAKKELKAFNQETATCCFWLVEEELLRMSAAIVDAGLYSGTKLYVTKYIEPSIQEASVITYTPSLSILTLIEENPNIVEKLSQELNKEVRKELENRLADSMDMDVSAINWDVNSNNRYVAADTETKTGSEIKTGTKTETELKMIPQTNSINEEEIGELGKTSDYLYFVDQVEERDGEIEYGE